MLAKKFQPSHLYKQIRDELENRIAKNEYPSGSSLPNEFTLAQEMGVSIGTVRKAVDMLCDDRLVVRIQGRGTHVIDRQSSEYQNKIERIRHADGTAIRWRLRELQREVRPATDVEIQKLQLDAGSLIIAFRRIREIGEEPVKVEYSRLPYEIYGSVDGLEVQETTVENLSVRKGVTISLIEERLTIVGSDEVLSNDLRIPPGTHLLRMERVALNSARASNRVAYLLLPSCGQVLSSPFSDRSKGLRPRLATNG